MNADFDEMTALTAVAVLIVLVGLGAVIYAQIRLSLIDFATQAAAQASAEMSPGMGAAVERYSTMRLGGLATLVGGVAVFVFDVLGGTARVLAELGRD